MTQEEHDAILNSKIDKLVTQNMILERWFPENVPFKGNGEVDFKQFEDLWKKEVEERRLQFILHALTGDDYDVYSHDGETPNIDRILKEREKQFNNESSMHH